MGKAGASHGRMSSGFAEAVRLYLRVLVGVMAVVGLCLLIGLQAGWIALVAPDKVEPDDSATAVEIDDRAGAVEIIGPETLFSKEMTVVDPRKTYQLEADIRVLPREDGSDQVSAVYLGVATYDAEGKELRSGPGTYRYAGASDRKVSSEDGWVHIAGTITGEGDANHNQFRPGTHSIKLVLLANFRSKDKPVMLIRNVRFSEVVTLAPLAR